ncbi:DUF1456 family protein [Mesoflavibacter sp. SCSIO 43206]|jgi:hypothetical protein|uniref:DUF1456 family protein n=1 Tax=Mesoflavibacter TaxID=444051 RepID=UPI001CA95AC4|nr:DUF1456 family protein [Mesoflavibacter sp. SCSIO 43206]UAB74594.1 DUF1456 family protein [Mesoflavibacter sp. SCSIO 43206]
MTNNDIFKKLRVAHKLRDTDIIEILALVDFRVTKSELSAFFRREDHPNYVECGDQILRNFLNGLIIHLRGPMPKKGEQPKGNPTTKTNTKKFNNKKNFNKPKSKKD